MNRHYQNIDSTHTRSSHYQNQNKKKYNKKHNRRMEKILTNNYKYTFVDIDSVTYNSSKNRCNNSHIYHKIHRIAALMNKQLYIDRVYKFLSYSPVPWRIETFVMHRYFDNETIKNIKLLPTLCLTVLKNQYKPEMKIVNNAECIMTNIGTIGSFNNDNSIIFCGYNEKLSFMAKLSSTTKLTKFFVRLIENVHGNIFNFKCYLLGANLTLFNDILDHINITNNVYHNIFQIYGQSCTVHVCNYKSIILNTKSGIISHLIYHYVICYGLKFSVNLYHILIQKKKNSIYHNKCYTIFSRKRIFYLIDDLDND